MAGDSFNFKAPDYYNFENSGEDGEDADDFFSKFSWFFYVKFLDKNL